MVVVHEHDLGSDLAYLVYRRSLHSRASSHRHEYGGLYYSMRRRDGTSSSETIGRIEGEGKRIHKIRIKKYLAIIYQGTSPIRPYA